MCMQNTRLMCHQVKYYASHAQGISGGTTVLLNVFTDFARGEYERCQKTTVRLQSACDNFEVAQIDFAPSGPRKTEMRQMEEEWNKELEERAKWIELWEAYNARQQEMYVSSRQYPLLLCAPAHTIDLVRAGSKRSPRFSRRIGRRSRLPNSATLRMHRPPAVQAPSQRPLRTAMRRPATSLASARSS